MSRRRRLRVRRAGHLLCYWRSGSFLVYNYATGVTAAVSPLVLQLLDACTEWCTLDALTDALASSLPGGPPAGRLVRGLVERLIASTVLELEGDTPHPARVAMDTFNPWNPAAGFFHTATKDVKFLPAAKANRILERKSQVHPAPPPVTRYRGAPLVKLPRPTRVDDVFTRTLLERRTWRRFSSAPVSSGDLARLLDLSVGVQKWVKTGIGDVPLKTSPSGGARHPIECYVVVTRVTGLRPGLYHYAADARCLERITGGDLTGRLRAWMPQSRYFAKAAFVAVFTAVFTRQLWRYPYARAYRAALVEAGHVCQTFCLTATWLGLAPFCLMGLADTEIERDLRIDGVGESVLYAAGAGARPHGVAWAPLSRGVLPVRSNRRR